MTRRLPIKNGIIVNNGDTVNMSSRDTATRGYPAMKGRFLRTVSYLVHV